MARTRAVPGRTKSPGRAAPGFLRRLRPFVRRWFRSGADLLAAATTRRGIVVTRPAGRTHRPVLLLYGFLQNGRVLSALHRRLTRDRFTVFTVHLGGLLNTFNTHGIPNLAGLVRDEVERLCRETGVRRLAIVGHSEGGLVARYYVKKLGGHRRVTHLVTLGTPHHGTPLAYIGIVALGALARSVWQMTPMSPFIRELKRGRFPSSVKLTSIYSRNDRIAPYPSCLLELKPGERTCNIEIDRVGHVGLLLSGAAHEVVRAELRDEVPRNPRGGRTGVGRVVAIEKSPPARRTPGDGASVAARRIAPRRNPPSKARAR